MSVCFELQQESDNALAIQLREKILNKIEKAKSPQELKNIIISIVTENEADINLEALQEENLLPKLEGYFACTIQGNQDRLSDTQIEVGELLKKAIDLICHPPTFNIPSPFPVIDISGEFLKQILMALLRLGIKILISIIKKLLALLVDVCASGLSALNGYGDVSIGDMIRQSIGDEVADSFIGDVLNAFGMESSGTSAKVTMSELQNCEEGATPIDNMQSAMKFLDDLSFMLTPVEVCGLLNNKANEQTFQVVEELLNYEYPSLRTRLNNRDKIAGLFKTLGSRNDPAICDLIENNAQMIMSRPDICFTEDVNKVRTNLLNNKGLTPDEITEQLNKERARHKDNLEKIAELASQIKSNPDKLFGEQPNIFCKDGKPGIVSLDMMPSLKENLSLGLDTIFNQFAVSIDKNLQSFPSTVTTTRKTLNTTSPVIRKFHNTSSVDQDGNYIELEDVLNPTFLQRVANGDYELCDGHGNIDKDSVTSYYSSVKVNDVAVFIDDKYLDVQALIRVTNKGEITDGPKNVYIRNYNKTNKLMDNITSILDEEKIDEFISLNFEEMSIQFNTTPTATTQNNLIIYPIGKKE